MMNMQMYNYKVKNFFLEAVEAGFLCSRLNDHDLDPVRTVPR